MEEERIINRRIKQGDTIVYPYTRQENVINLQKTIKEKMAIVSPGAPQQGTYVNRQAWLKTEQSESDESLVNNQTHLEEPELPDAVSQLEDGLENLDDSQLEEDL